MFEPSDTAAKNMIWDERRLIVWDLFHLLLQFYKFMIRSGLFERAYKSPKDVGCSLHRARGSAIVIFIILV